MTSGLDARVVFYPLRALPEKVRAQLVQLPGMWLRPRLSAPWNVAWLVERILRSAGVPYRIEAKGQQLRTDATGHDLEAQVGQHLIGTELHPWVWYDFMLPFQRAAVSMAVARDGGHIWAAPGSGKTVMAIVWALAHPGPVLVVTGSPLTVKEQWRREVERFADVEPLAYRAPSQRRHGTRCWGATKGDARCGAIVVEGNYCHRHVDQAGTTGPYLHEYAPDDFEGYVAAQRAHGRRPFVVAGWALLREHWDELLSVLQPVSIVLDESHSAKQPKRDRWIPVDDGLKAEAIDNTSRAAYELCCRIPRRLCTTATPIPNRLGTDLYGQLTLAEPWSWGRTGRKFSERYAGGHQGEYGWVADDPDRQQPWQREELRSRLAFTATRVPYETSHGELPAKRRTVRYVPPEDQDKPVALSRELKKAAKEAQGGDVDAKERLLEIRLIAAASRKRTAVKRTVADLLPKGGGSKGKVIVFTGRRRDCDELGKLLAATAKKAGADMWVAHGDTPQQERVDIMQAYMDHEGPCILVGTYQAWGQSLNLHDTDYLLMAMLPYTPGMLDQAEGRVHRLGMSRPVTYVYLVAEGTADETIAELVLTKLDPVEQVVGEGGLGGLGDALAGLEDRESILDDMVSRLALELS